MFVHFHESLSPERIGANPVHLDWLDALLSGHRLGNFIVVPTRREIVSISALNIGRVANATLNYISRKLNEYAVASAQSSRVLIACDDAFESNFRITAGREIRISARLLDHRRTSTKAFFLAEHLTDIKILQVIIDRFLTVEKYPVSFLSYRGVLGGGSSIADALEAEEPSPLKGLVVCDSDRAADVPPFVRHSTGDHAHQRAIDITALSGALGWSDVSPMFAFLATWGRTIENYVGPNLLESYFLANNRRAERAIFTNAFPNFPRLSSQELKVWRGLNLKDGSDNHVVSEVLDELRASHGMPEPTMLPHLRHYGSVKFPGDVTQWVIDNGTSSRWSGSITAGIASDMRAVDYEAAIRKASELLREVTAGDRNAARL